MVNLKTIVYWLLFYRVKFQPELTGPWKKNIKNPLKRTEKTTFSLQNLIVKYKMFDNLYINAMNESHNFLSIESSLMLFLVLLKHTVHEWYKMQYPQYWYYEIPPAD